MKSFKVKNKFYLIIMNIKRISLSILFLLLFHFVDSQELKDVQSYQIVDIKGSVYFNGSKLKLDSVIEIFDLFNSARSIRFASKFDCVRIKNTKTNKTQPLYAMRPSNCIGCLGSRGVNNIILPYTDLLSYFSETQIIFDADTLILTKTSIKPDSNNVLVFSFLITEISSNQFRQVMATNDTLILSREKLFADIDGDIKNYASIFTEGFNLFILNIKTGATSNIIINGNDLPKLRIFFFQDIVLFLKSLGLTFEEICEEILEKYIDFHGVIVKNPHLSSEKEVEIWFKNKIKEAYNSD